MADREPNMSAGMGDVPARRYLAYQNFWEVMEELWRRKKIDDAWPFRETVRRKLNVSTTCR